MFTVEQAPEVFPTGTRVRHRYLDRTGAVAQRPAGQIGAGKTYDDDISGWCVSINVLWDDGQHRWTGPRQLARLDEEPPRDPAAILSAFAAGMSELSKGMAQVQRTMRASGAMGLAYRGDIGGLRAALAALPAEQVREISAAAALLASTADEVLTGRPVPEE